MRTFLFILTNNLIPIFTLIIAGILIDRKFKLDIGTLSKINLYFFVPAFIFVNAYSTVIPMDMLWALGTAVIVLVLNYLLSFAVGKLRGFDKGMSNAFSNSIMFYNSGNFGIPLITLVFSSKPFVVNGETPYLDYALTIQVMVMIVQNVSLNTLGVFNASNAAGGFTVALKKAARMPSLYFATAAFLFKLVPFDLTKIPLWPALSYAKNGLVAMALLSLGVQLSHTRLKLSNPDVFLSVFLRLIGGPAIALLLISIFGFQGIMARVLMISTSVPTAVNTALIGVEFENHPEFASQVVMLSTAMSAVTLTGVIYLSGILFPV